MSLQKAKVVQLFGKFDNVPEIFLPLYFQYLYHAAYVAFSSGNGHFWTSNAMPVFYCNNNNIITYTILFVSMMVGLYKHYLI